MPFLAKWTWLAAILFGIVLACSGLFMVRQGFLAQDEVRDALKEERITTSDDAAIPSVPVDGPEEAKAQAEAIQEDVLNMTGGKTYSELARDDPLRSTYERSLTLRSALMQSYLAFKVSDFVMGVGAIVAVLGVSHVVLGVYLRFVGATARARAMGTQQVVSGALG